MVDNKENKARIKEVHRQRAEKVVYEENINLSAPEQKMLELLRVDTLMRSMNFLVDESTEEGSSEFDEALSNLITAYKGSYSLVYGGEKTDFDNILAVVRSNMDVTSSFSSYDNITKVIPETSSQIAEINKTLSNITNIEQELADLGDVKKGRLSSSKDGKDEEALAILEKLMEKYKKQDKSAKIQKISYTPSGIAVSVIVKKSLLSTTLRGEFFEGLDSPEGVARLNDALAGQYQKASAKADRKVDNTKILESKKKIEEDFAKENRFLVRQHQELSKTIKEHLQKLPSEELLSAFDGRNAELEKLFKNHGNMDKLKPIIVKSFEEDSKIWNYVLNAKYYNMIKETVRVGYDKNSFVYKAMSPQLKNLLEIREMSLNGLKSPDANSIDAMNKSLEKHNHRINLQKMVFSKDEKPEEYRGKTSSAIASTILNKAQNAEDKFELTPYKRRYVTLGLMYSLGEGKEKNDDDLLFRKYMQVYFDKKNFTPIDAIKLKKEYAWEEFKANNINLAKGTYQEIQEIYAWEEFKNKNAKTSKGVYKELKDNAVNADALKEGLLNGIWVDTGISSVHHICPRRFGALSSNPDEVNNQPNLSITVQWKAWQDDNHQKDHFFNMSQHDGVLSYLTKENGDYKRKGETAGLSEVYYEKPQVKKDGKWEDLIPNNTLLVTPNVILAAPDLPASVKKLTLDCFKPLSILEEVATLKRAKEKDHS